jgi:hypothetical protein
MGGRVVDKDRVERNVVVRESLIDRVELSLVYPFSWQTKSRAHLYGFASPYPGRRRHYLK